MACCFTKRDLHPAIVRIGNALHPAHGACKIIGAGTGGRTIPRAIQFGEVDKSWSAFKRSAN